MHILIHRAALYECGVNKDDRQDIIRIFYSAIILLMAGGMEHFPNISSLKHCKKHHDAIGIFGVKKNQSSSVIDLARIGKANSPWKLPSLALRQVSHLLEEFTILHHTHALASDSGYVQIFQSNNILR